MTINNKGEVIEIKANLLPGKFQSDNLKNFI